MLKNYLKIAWRNLTHNKGFAFINIGGLAVGVGCCLLIFLYVQDELSYDDFHTNADRIYRVLREFDVPGLETTIPHTPYSLGEIEKSVSTIEETVRIKEAAMTIKRGTRKFVEPDFTWADEEFFNIFSFPLVQGEAALDRPGTVVISEKMSQKYFPQTNPIGQSLSVGEYSLEVTGVMEVMPQNSSLQYDFVSSLKTQKPKQGWNANNYITYIILKRGASKKAVLPQIDKVVSANTQYERGDGFIPHLQPLTGIHLGQGVSVEVVSTGNIQYVYLFAALAFFILMLACINFMNLATARSSERAREVGVRKTLGGQRLQLTGQFLCEAILLSVAATVLAIMLARLGLPLLNSLSGKSLSLVPLFDSSYVLFLLGLPLVVGLIAGLYPAIVLSGFKPVEVLHGSIQTGRCDRRFRRTLVIFQFAVSIVILVGTMVVYQQLRFMQSTDLGFNKNNVVVINRTGHLGEQIETFMQELEQLSNVKEVASAFSVPGTFFLNQMWPSSEPGAKPRNLDYSYVSENYTETLGIEMVAGQDFGPATSDTFAVMLNETAVTKYGWTSQEAIGKAIQQGSYEFEIVGVMKNYHYESLHQEIYPMMFFPEIDRQNRVVARIKPDNVPTTLASMRSSWEQFSSLPFNYSFLADDLAAQYREESRLATVFITFTVLAVLVACLGLFSLAAYTIDRRTKEIGIRKVLGATVTGIVGMLSKDSLKLILLSFIIAVPVSLYAMNQWLQNFAYRIEIGLGIFLLAGVLALLIALATVSWQSFRAATVNPVESLNS